jgi:hypothetical protein
MRLLGRTLLGSRNLVREATTVLIDLSWKLASELVKLVDNTRKSLLALEISVSENVHHSLIVVLAKSLQVPEVPSAR